MSDSRASRAPTRKGSRKGATNVDIDAWFNGDGAQRSPSPGLVAAGDDVGVESASTLRAEAVQALRSRVFDELTRRWDLAVQTQKEEAQELYRRSYDAAVNSAAKHDQAVRGSVNFDTMPLIPRGPRRKRLGENGDVAEANGTGEAAMEPMVMPPSRKLPVCISWCPIPRSVYSEDETTLQHIPYVGDGDNVDFLTSFLENFHDLSLFEGDAAELAVLDSFLVDIVESAMRDMPHVACVGRPKSSASVAATRDSSTAAASSISETDNDIDSVVPAPILFQAISEGLGTRLRNNAPDIIRTRYYEICKAAESGAANADTFRSAGSPSAASGSRSKSSGKGSPPRTARPSANREKLALSDTVCTGDGECTDSYTSLLCRICCLYECCFHRESPACRPTQNGCHKAGPLRRASDSPETPCERQCFRTQSSLSAKKRGKAANKRWTTEEEAMVKKGVALFTGADPCNVAAFVGSRSCRDVYEHLRNSGTLIDLTVNSPPRARSGENAAASSAAFDIEPHSPEGKFRGRKRKRDKVPVPRVESGARRDESTVKGRIFAPPLKPCDHVGPCKKGCPCIDGGFLCERYCQCDGSCSNRAVGCHCQGGCRMGSCPCYANGRECDPDLCKSCGATEFDSKLTDGGQPVVNVRSDSKCGNVRIQRGQHKKLKISVSEVAGWGVFLAEPAKRGDFVAEYCGEIISQDEAERRGKLYDHWHLSFLFNLNRECVVDSTRKGNKIRFANHSANPNCIARIQKVCGENRIGIFAKEDMEADTEVMYDYLYDTTDENKYVPL